MTFKHSPSSINNWTEAELSALCPDWPTSYIDHYQASGLWQTDTLSDMLERNARLTPDAIALIANNHQWSYTQLQAQVERYAQGFKQLGLKRYDRVVLQLPNCGEFIVALFALLRINVLPIMALPAHRYHEIHHFCEFTRAKAIITLKNADGFDFEAMAHSIAESVPTIEHVVICDTAAPESRHSLTSQHSIPFDALDMPYSDAMCLPPMPCARDLALFQLSGGTTGVSKLIPRRHDSYLCSVRGSNRVCDIARDTRYLVVLPASHNFVLSSPGILGVLHAGGTVVMSTSSLPEDCFRMIQQHQITLTSLVPPLALAWLKFAERSNPVSAHESTSSLRSTESLSPKESLASLGLLQIGGARLAEETAQRITTQLDCPLQQVFGMAEGLVNFTRQDESLHQIHTTQGQPMYPAHDEIKIVDERDIPVPEGEVGELLTRGPYTIRGYFNHPKANEGSFTADGFYRTGDLVLINEEGNLVVKGRKKEQINRGGEKISMDEIENILSAHPDVHDAVVVGIADALLGERAVAFVILANTAGTVEPLLLSPAAHAQHVQKLMLYLRQHVAAFKIPDKFHFVKEFPLSGIGKNSRKVLRERLIEAASKSPVAR
ncbi:2,3-dihydroxybenzoate-AMP ligase [Halomonadaceae bacterium LMG 33818]|uniref:(2,3-dihydroxybenzoyl)adenylate synthase n=1 Tax=Cernens ardua TaxID=3402176 RepID=UPI003EDB7A53